MTAHRWPKQEYRIDPEPIGWRLVAKGAATVVAGTVLVAGLVAVYIAVWVVNP